jgi:hypothetical protein
VKREARLLVITDCGRVFCAVVLRGCWRAEKVFLALSLDELIKELAGSSIMGEVRVCYTAARIAAESASARLPCRLQSIDKLDALPLPCGSSGRKLVLEFLSALCTGVDNVVIGGAGTG